MRLELNRIEIKDVVLSDKMEVVDSVLYINEKEIIEELKTIPGVEDVKIDIAKPGEKTRIIPVKDAISPRCKVEGGEGGFPGVTTGLEQAGSGVVNVLDKVTIMTIGDIVGFQEGVVDMWGEGAKYTPFSKTINIVVDISAIEGLAPHKHEEAVRIAGLRASELVGEAAREAKASYTEVFEKGTFAEEEEKCKGLPKVIYCEMLIAQGLLHDGYIYGHDAKTTLPTYLHPNEELDNAVISGNCVAACDKITTFQHQENAVIRDLYELHGKEINFLGVLMVPEMTTLAGKQRTTQYTVNLAHQLGADGVIVSEEGYGNPDSDLVMISAGLEKLGIKTVLITDECSGWDGMSQPLTDTAEEAIAVVSTGNVSHLVELEKADRILGDPMAVENIAGGWAGAYDPETGIMKCELNAVIGATSEIGFHNCTVELY